MEMINDHIDYLLRLILSKIGEEVPAGTNTLEHYKTQKARLSGRGVQHAMNINENQLREFEDRWRHYIRSVESGTALETSAYRLVVLLEGITRALQVQYTRPLPANDKGTDMSIKQVRAFELILRDLIYEQIGKGELLAKTLSELFNDIQMSSWIKNSDETGLLSGTTFSELTNIFISPGIYNSFKYHFDRWKWKISADSRESLRFAFDDIRMIRNQIAHNKIVSPAQIELLNLYFEELTRIVQQFPELNIELKKYSLNDGVEKERFLSKLSEDRREYWQSFIRHMEDSGMLPVSHRLYPPKHHWMEVVRRNITTPNGQTSKVSVNAVANNQKKVVSVELFIAKDMKKDIIGWLMERELENSRSSIHEDIVWDLLNGGWGSRIIYSKEGDFMDRSDWEEQFQWLGRYVQAFLDVFGKYLN